MKISIIPDDDIVLIDFESVHGIDAGLSGDVHALQWHNDSGHIEYRNGLVETITEFPLPDLVDKFNARKDELAASVPEPTAEQVAAAEAKSSAIGKLKSLGLNDAEIASITGG